MQERSQKKKNTVSVLSQRVVVASSTRRLLSDSGAFADWAASSSSAVGRAVAPDDLSLGFNAASLAGGAPAWPPASSRSGVNYSLPPDMGMVGLRDVFVVAPATSFHHPTSHHHHHHHHHNDQVIADSSNGSNNSAATALGMGVGVGVIPLLTAGPCLGPPQNAAEGDNGNLTARGGGRAGAAAEFQLWQNQQSSHHYLKKSAPIIDHGNSGALIQSGGGGGIGASSSSTATCQDCGNQAKKDCSYRRCRTCCKSRGFDCATHVKSTWVPASRRRERQLMTSTTTAGGTGGSVSTSGAKKPRLVGSQTTTTSHTSTSNTTPPRSFDTSSSRQDASFKESLPGQVRAPAVFKCVRVTSVDDEEDEYAYQAVVKIGGHVFKGFLYDRGVEEREDIMNLSDLHLGGGGGGDRNGASSSSPIMDPSDVYASGGGLLGGSSYGNPIN